MALIRYRGELASRVLDYDSVSTVATSRSVAIAIMCAVIAFSYRVVARRGREGHIIFGKDTRRSHVAASIVYTLASRRHIGRNAFNVMQRDRLG